jgi:uncharacterized protein
MAGYGSFVWYELMTADVDAAETFYGKALGWKTAAIGHPGMDYRFITTGDTRIGGMMNIPENACEAGCQPGWLGYIAVEDADACARSVEAKGGRIHRAPEDIPGYGRFAVLADPQGAAFAVIALAETLVSSQPGEVYRRGVPGFGGWHELYANDWEAAFAFYSDLFGWTKDQAVDLGGMGVYQLYAINGVVAGGMMNRAPQSPGPCWNYYFNVESIEAAAARVKEAGAQILMGPHEVPDGSWILVGLDPQGAAFALVSREP